jgi:predicted thioesterase
MAPGKAPTLDHREATRLPYGSVVLRLGAQTLMEAVVTEADTASSMGSGDVDVLATGRVVALCEAAAMAALAGGIQPGQTTVGSRIELSHVAPVAVGSSVRALVTLERLEGRRAGFSVSVTDARGLVAVGKMTRVIVDRTPFLDRAR